MICDRALLIGYRARELIAYRALLRYDRALSIYDRALLNENVDLFLIEFKVLLMDYRARVIV